MPSDQRLEKLIETVIHTPLDVEHAWNELIDLAQESRSSPAALPFELLFQLGSYVHRMVQRGSWPHLLGAFAPPFAGPVPAPMTVRVESISEPDEPELAESQSSPAEPRPFYYLGEEVLGNLRRLIGRALDQRPKPWSPYEELSLKIYYMSLSCRNDQVAQTANAILNLATSAGKKYPQAPLAHWAAGRAAKLYARAYRKERGRRSPDPKQLWSIANSYATCLSTALSYDEYTARGVCGAAQVPGLLFSIAWTLFRLGTPWLSLDAPILGAALQVMQQPAGLNALLDAHLDLGSSRLLDRIGACVLLTIAHEGDQTRSLRLAFAREALLLAVRYLAERPQDWTRLKPQFPAGNPLLDRFVERTEMLSIRLRHEPALADRSLPCEDSLVQLIRDLVRCFSPLDLTIDEEQPYFDVGAKVRDARAFLQNENAQQDPTWRALFDASRHEEDCEPNQQQRAVERAVEALTPAPRGEAPGRALLRCGAHYQHGRSLQQQRRLLEAIVEFRKARRAALRAYLLPYAAQAQLAVYRIYKKADAHSEARRTASALSLLSELGQLANCPTLSISYAVMIPPPEIERDLSFGCPDDPPPLTEMLRAAMRSRERQLFDGRPKIPGRYVADANALPSYTRLGLWWVAVLSHERKARKGSQQQPPLLVQAADMLVHIAPDSYRIEPLRSLHGGLSIALEAQGVTDRSPAVWPNARYLENGQLFNSWTLFLQQNGNTLSLRQYTEAVMALLSLCLVGPLNGWRQRGLAEMRRRLEKETDRRRAWWRDTDLEERAIELRARAANLEEDRAQHHALRVEQFLWRQRILPELRAAGLGRRPSLVHMRDLASSLDDYVKRAAELEPQELEQIFKWLDRIKGSDLALDEIAQKGKEYDEESETSEELEPLGDSITAPPREDRAHPAPDVPLIRSEFPIAAGAELILDYFLVPNGRNGVPWDALCLVSQVVRNGPALAFEPLRLFPLGMDGSRETEQRKPTQHSFKLLDQILQRETWVQTALTDSQMKNTIKGGLKNIHTLITSLGKTLFSDELQDFLIRTVPRHIYICPHHALYQVPIHALPIKTAGASEALDEKCLLDLGAWTVSYLTKPRSLLSHEGTPPIAKPPTGMITDIADPQSVSGKVHDKLINIGVKNLHYNKVSEIPQLIKTQHSVVFACHGICDRRLGRSGRSRLLLPHGVRLSAALLDELGVDLAGSEVLLAACSGSLTRYDAGGQTGLLDALLRQNTAYVVGALYPIYDEHAAVFASSYVTARTNGDAPAAAYLNSVKTLKTAISEQRTHELKGYSSIPKLLWLLAWLEWSPYLMYGPAPIPQ